MTSFVFTVLTLLVLSLQWHSAFQCLTAAIPKGFWGKHFFSSNLNQYIRPQPRPNKLCGRLPQYAPAPSKLTFDLESGVRVTCDVSYLCANFGLSRPLCSRLRPDAHDRQTDVEHASLLNAPYPRGGGIITMEKLADQTVASWLHKSR